MCRQQKCAEERGEERERNASLKVEINSKCRCVGPGGNTERRERSAGLQ